MNDTDTIVAISTPPGRGGIGVVRLSGMDAKTIGEKIANIQLVPRKAIYADFLGNGDQLIDQGLALFFHSPHSYTGEDVVELQGHGSSVVMQMLLKRCVELGARLAKPGEYSERAFLNGQMDLTQAEGVADLIESSTESAARSALRSLQGDFSKRVHELVDEVTALRIFVEAAIDFPDEEIDFLEDANVVEQLNILSRLFTSLRSSLGQGKIIRDGFKVVLTGLPNAGKSSLLNALSNEDRAIVSDIPGTTRDTLEQYIQIDGLPIHILDTAGIRETTNEIEAEGVRRSLAAQAEADLVILVVDNANFEESEIQTLFDQQDSSKSCLVVRNKIDLPGDSTKRFDREIQVSAMDGTGLDVLREKIKCFAGFQGNEDSPFLGRQRHIDALQRAESFLNNGLEQQAIHQAGELLADDLNSCQKALGEITGEISSDDLLGLIFGSFCIGK